MAMKAMHGLPISTMARPPAIGHGLLGRGDREDDERVHLFLFLYRNIVVGVEQAGGRVAPGHLAGDLCRQVADVEGLDPADAGPARQNLAPDILDTHAQRADNAEAGNDDTSHITVPLLRNP